MKLAAAGGAGVGDDAERAKRRIAAGIAVSLALHALVLNLRRDGWRHEAQAPPRPIAVRLRPPPPPPAPAPQVETTPPSRPVPRARPDAQSRRPPPVIAVNPAPVPAHPDPFTVPQAPQSAPEAPHFDREAARRMARSLASMRDPAKEGTAVGQFPDQPLEAETRAARAISAAKRRDCKDGLPGGLLGPLLILADKKDSGCKW